MWCGTADKVVLGRYGNVIEDRRMRNQLVVDAGDVGREKMVLWKLGLWLFERDGEGDKRVIEVEKAEAVVARTEVEVVKPYVVMEQTVTYEHQNITRTSLEELSIPHPLYAQSEESSDDGMENVVMPGSSKATISNDIPSQPLSRLRVKFLATDVDVTVDHSLLVLVDDLSRGSKTGALAGPTDWTERMNPLRICGKVGLPLFCMFSGLYAELI